jgi:hypothetical protein
MVAIPLNNIAVEACPGSRAYAINQVAIIDILEDWGGGSAL